MNHPLLQLWVPGKCENVYMTVELLGAGERGSAYTANGKCQFVKIQSISLIVSGLLLTFRAP